MKYALGIDVGGTKIASGLVDETLKIHKLMVQSTFRRDLVGQIENIISQYAGFTAIGIGMPGQVFSSGQVGKLANIPEFQPVNLRAILQKKFKVPVSIVNDAKAFTLAEAVAGAGKKHDIVVGITLGTGIGTGIVIHERIYSGADGVAGEFGHIPLPGGGMLEKQIKQAGIFSSAQAAAKFLDLLLGFVVFSFNPEIIVLGGGWSNVKDMEKVVNLSLAKLTYPTKTKVALSKIKSAGVVGAALVALKK